MVLNALLWFVGFQINAPAAYFALLIFDAIVRFGNFVISLEQEAYE